MPRRLFLTIILLAQWSMLSAGNFYQAGRTVKETEYWALIQKAGEIAQQFGADEIITDPEMSRLAFQIQEIAAVETDSGQIIPVNNDLLVRQLLSPESTAKDSSSMIKALLDAHEQFPDAVFSSADIDSLKEITSRPEFQWEQAQPSQFEEWWQGMLDRFFRWLDKLLGGRQGSGQGEAGRPSPLPFIATILLAVVIFFVFRTLFADLINEARAKDSLDEAQEPLTADAAFDKAQNLSRSGDYRSAVRYLYLSSLLLLDERGLLRYDRSKTNREYLRSVARSPELAQPLAEVIDVFDNVWYGFHQLDEETFQHYSKRVEELKEKRQ